MKLLIMSDMSRPIDQRFISPMVHKVTLFLAR